MSDNCLVLGCGTVSAFNQVTIVRTSLFVDNQEALNWLFNRQLVHTFSASYFYSYYIISNSRQSSGFWFFVFVEVDTTSSSSSFFSVSIKSSSVVLFVAASLGGASAPPSRLLVAPSGVCGLAVLVPGLSWPLLVRLSVTGSVMVLCLVSCRRNTLKIFFNKILFF